MPFMLLFQPEFGGKLVFLMVLCACIHVLKAVCLLLLFKMPLNDYLPSCIFVALGCRLPIFILSDVPMILSCFEPRSRSGTRWIVISGSLCRSLCPPCMTLLDIDVFCSKCSVEKRHSSNIQSCYVGLHLCKHASVYIPDVLTQLVTLRSRMRLSSNVCIPRHRSTLAFSPLPRLLGHTISPVSDSNFVAQSSKGHLSTKVSFMPWSVGKISLCDEQAPNLKSSLVVLRVCRPSHPADVL